MINNNFTHYGDVMRYKQIPLVDHESTSLLKSNKIKVNNIKNNLAEYEKNPNFYRNKQIIAVAVAVAAIATVAILTYFCWAIALPVCVGAIGTGHASGLAIGGSMITPVIAAIGGSFGVAYLFKSLDGDKKTLEKLETENNVLKNKIQSKIKLCDEYIESSKAATTKQFTEEAWTAMKDISTLYYSTILNEIDTNQKKEATWLINQHEIISFRKKNELVKQTLEAVL